MYEWLKKIRRVWMWFCEKIGSHLRGRWLHVLLNPRPAEPSFLEVRVIERARQEWISAKNYFDSVTEPELVDHAIFLMEAAQRKYSYLLRKARKEKVSLVTLERAICGNRTVQGA